MKGFKKALRYIARFILSFILFILIYLFFSWLLPYFKVNSSFKNAPDGIEIFLQSNGVHTDLVMPVKNELINWNELAPYSHFENVNSDFGYIAMGWGDKGFYLDTPTWADLKISTALKAAFGIGNTAMHITYKNNAPQLNKLCKKVVISKEQYQLLIGYILSSFQLEDQKPILIDHPGYSPQDCFYEAKGTYHMFNTCNVWTGNALKAAGVKIGVWTPFHQGIVGHLE